MRTIRIALVVIVVLIGGVAWAGKEAYRLVMSKNEKVCRHMLTLFNADMKKYRGLVYDKHKEFIVWEPVETGETALDKYCYQTLKQFFDINNDGTKELVIRTRSCFQSQLVDRLYVFPLDSNAVELLKNSDSKVLWTTEDKMEWNEYVLRSVPGTKKGELLQGIGPVFTFEPFEVGKTFYVSMTDLSHDWIVIAKYLHGQELDDVCYFQGKPH